MFKKFKLKRRDANGSVSTIASGSSSVNEAGETDSIYAGSNSGYQVKNIKKDLPFRLHRAAWKNNDEKLARIMEEKDRKGHHKNSLLVVDKHKRTALHIAACGQNIRIIDLLLTRDGATALLLQDDEGNTPLHKSIECNKSTITMRFAKVRCCKDAANTKNSKGHTPLHIAAQLGNKEGGEKILEAGGFVDHEDNDGNTPLALAVIHSSLEFVDLMKNDDATVDTTNENGETPLMLAVRADNIEMVKKLLTFRMINPGLKDNSNRSALDYAEELKTKEILNELNKWHKNDNTLPPAANVTVTNTVRTNDDQNKLLNQDDEETMTERESVDTFSEIDVDIPAAQSTAAINLHQMLLQSNYYDPEEDERNKSNSLKQEATPTSLQPKIASDVDTITKSGLNEVKKKDDTATNKPKKKDTATDKLKDDTATNKPKKKDTATDKLKEDTATNKLKEDTATDRLTTGKPDDDDAFDGSLTDISISDDDAEWSNIKAITNPRHVTTSNNNSTSLSVTTPIQQAQQLVHKPTPANTTVHEVVVAPVSTKGQTDIHELLEEGWDSDTDNKSSHNNSNNITIKKEKDENIPKKVMNDDVLELLQDGWDSSEEEFITTSKEVDPTHGPFHKQWNNRDIGVLTEEKREDTQELLEQGWDSDTEHSDEDILTPKHNSTPVHVPVSTKPLMNLSVISSPMTTPSSIMTTPYYSISTSKQVDHTPVSVMTSPIAIAQLKPITTTTKTAPHVIKNSSSSVTTPHITKSTPPLIPTTCITKRLSSIPVVNQVTQRPTTNNKEFMSQPMNMIHFSVSTDSDSSIDVPVPASRRVLPKRPITTTSSNNSVNTSAGVISPNSLYGTSGLLPQSTRLTPALMITPIKDLVIDEQQSDRHSLLSPCSSNNDSILSESAKDRQSFKKYEEVCEEKRKIAKIRMDQEVEIRQLKYKLEQFEEEIQSTIEEKEKLLEQLCQCEKRISKEVQEKQLLELNCKESEIQSKTIIATLQQTKEELEKMKSLVISEREENNLKSAALTQQQELYQNLKSEVAITTEQYGKASEQLVTGDVTQKSLKTKIFEMESELISANVKLTHALNDKVKLIADVELAEERTAQTEAMLRQEKDSSVSKTQEKHTLELRVQELEINHQSLLATKEQLRVELENTKAILREEQDKGSHKETELVNKRELYRSLQEEIKKVIEEKARLSVLLDKAGDTRATLESKVSDLEGQLTSVNSCLANELSAKMQLMKNVGEADRRAEERKSFIEEEKMRHHMIVESLQADVKRAESDSTAKLQQIMSLKEKLASNKTSIAVMEKDIQNLKRELSSSSDHSTQLQERIQAIDQAYNELHNENNKLEQVISQLTQEMSSKEHELEETQRMTKKYQEVLEKAHDTLTCTAKERDEALAEKAGLQSQIIEFEGKVNNIIIELNQFEQKEKNYLQELDKLKKSRSSLQDLATKLRSENISLEHQLTDEVVQKERAQSENGELKEIWESEVKAKHKLTDRIMELELLQRDTDGNVNQEKRKIKKIIEQKEILQMKIDTLQEKNGGLQRENGEYKISLRETKKRLRMIETRHVEDLNRSKAAENSECVPLHKKITKLREQLKQETDHKLAAEDRSRIIEHELNITKRLLEDAKNELSQVTSRNKMEERKIITLTEELNTLQDHLSQLTVPKGQYDEVSCELKESNYENLKMAKNMSEARQKLNILLKDVEQLQSDKASALTEAIRYKELHDKEMAKRESLSARLDKTRSKMAYSKSRLNMERLETERLLEETHRRHNHNPSIFQSTPRSSYDGSLRVTSPVDDDLIQEVRSRLDRSIADHRDSTLTYSMLGRTSYCTETENHLDSIKRQYRL